MTKIGSPIRSAATIAAGLVVASGAAAAAFALLSGDIRTFTPALAIISIVAVVLGLPAYLAARAAQKETPLVASALGFVIGAAIPAVFLLPGPTADEASVGGTATVVNGSYTAAGWLQAVTLVGAFGLLGVGAALVFWLTVRRNRPTVSAEECTPATRPLPAKMLFVSAASVIVAAFIIPYVTADRSCHNTLRDGRDSIGPVANFDLHVGVDQWRNIEMEMDMFRRSGYWSVRDDVRTDPSFLWLQISLCKEPGTNIFVQGMPESGEVSFAVFQPQGGSSWRKDFRALYERISARWPTKVVFKGSDGKPTSVPQPGTFLVE